MTKRFRRNTIPGIFAALALLLTILLAGCGASAAAKAPNQGSGRTAAGGAQATVEACDLLTSDAAAAALGAPVGEPSRSSGGETIVITDCTYRTASDPAGRANLMLRRAPTIDLAREEYRQARPSLESQLGATIHDVTGLGEGAFWAEGTGVHQLTVLRGNVQLLITVRGSRTGPDEAAAVQLAGAALARLP